MVALSVKKKEEPATDDADNADLNPRYPRHRGELLFVVLKLEQ
jgi:hypothetical protein